MYKVTAWFRNEKVSKTFINVYDAIDFKDVMDANYPLHVEFEKGVKSMREMVYNSWEGLMNADVNPLKHIPDTGVRHLVLQVLAWMWCIVFSTYMGSIFVFGVSAVGHALLLAAIVITVGTFETAKNNPTFFLKKGYHTPSRARTVMYLSGKGKLEKMELDPRDPGGEHE